MVQAQRATLLPYMFNLYLAFRITVQCHSKNKLKFHSCPPFHARLGVFQSQQLVSSFTGLPFSCWPHSCTKMMLEWPICIVPTPSPPTTIWPLSSVAVPWQPLISGVAQIWTAWPHHGVLPPTKLPGEHVLATLLKTRNLRDYKQECHCCSWWPHRFDSSCAQVGWATWADLLQREAKTWGSKHLFHLTSWSSLCGRTQMDIANPARSSQLTPYPQRKQMSPFPPLHPSGHILLHTGADYDLGAFLQVLGPSGSTSLWHSWKQMALEHFLPIGPNEGDFLSLLTLHWLPPLLK